MENINIFKYEGKEYKFRTGIVSDLLAFVDIVEMQSSSDPKSSIKAIDYLAKFMDNLSADNVKYSKWKPFELTRMIEPFMKFLMFDIMGASPIEIESEDELKKKLVDAQKEYQNLQNSA